MENTKRKKSAEKQEEKTMRNFNAQNKVNNVKGSRKTAPMIKAAIAALAGAAVMLTGCGSDVPASSLPASGAAVTTSVSTTAAVTTASTTVKAETKTTGTNAVKAENKASNTNAVKAEQLSAENTAAKNTAPAAAAKADNIGIDEAAAIANVREQVGSGAQLISCTKGTAPDTGIACWVIVAAPITNGSTPETVTYYSGYQFCYTFENDNARNATASDGQNPMMNFIGTYSNGRAMMTVSCCGTDQAAIHISWSSSVSETSVWDMSGKADCRDDGLCVSYDNCVRKSYVYNENGELVSETVDYQNGSGEMNFMFAGNNVYWYDAVEGTGEGQVFTFCG